ncbi:MAG: sigma-70 family RNA polymerase sigma factor [Pseudomonadota bacterium]
MTPIAEDRWRRAMMELRAVIVRRGVRGTDVDDVVQASLEKALRHLDRLQDPARFEAWVKRIAANAALDEMRAAGRRAPHLDADAIPLAEAEEVPGPLAFAACVAPFIARLAAADAEVLRLKDLEERTFSALAAHLAISLPAAKARVRRARQRLAAALRSCCDAPPAPTCDTGCCADA